MSQQRHLDFVLKHYSEGAFDTKKAIERFKHDSGGIKSTTRRRTLSIVFAAISAAAMLALGVFLFRDTEKWTVIPVADAIKTLVLPDGTTVILTPGASLSYCFAESRAVRMSGKAYFEVFRDETKPFEIKSDDAFVKVLGTEFMLDAAEQPKVYVDRGKVLFAKSSESKGVILTAGMSARLENGAMIPTVDEKPDVNSIAWKRGTFIFDQTPLKDVLGCLSDYYHVSFAATDLTKKLSGEFAAEDLDLIIELIESALEVTIIRR